MVDDPTLNRIGEAVQLHHLLTRWLMSKTTSTTS